jgi:hypothetical protein
MHVVDVCVLLFYMRMDTNTPLSFSNFFKIYNIFTETHIKLTYLIKSSP